MEVGPQQLLFLLQDLYGKMKMTLLPSVIGFFASKVCVCVCVCVRACARACVCDVSSFLPASMYVHM